jgi:hypothetical protein
MTCRQLADEIAASQNVIRSREGQQRGRGRKPCPACNPLAGFRDVFARTQEDLHRLPVWNESVFKAVAKLELDSINDRMLKNSQKAAAEMATLEAQIGGTRVELEESVARIKSVLAQRAARKPEPQGAAESIATDEAPISDNRQSPEDK